MHINRIRGAGPKKSCHLYGVDFFFLNKVIFLDIFKICV